MKALAQRLGIVALLLAISMLPACSGQEPPAPEPEPPAAVELPAPTPQPQPEPPAAREFEATDTPSDVLTLAMINEGGMLQTVYFDYDRAEIRADQRAKLQANAQFLRENSSVRVLVAGHCDERGTREYNMALGERRASATMQYLVSLGVARDRIEIISYGEEQPAVRGGNESAWQQNRRTAFQAIETDR